YVEGDLIVRNCVFRDNVAYGDGYTYIAVFDLHPEHLDESRIILENNLFFGNSPGSGSTALVQSRGGHALITGNTFSDNTGGSTTLRVNGNATLHNNIFWDNETTREIYGHVWPDAGLFYEMTIDYCNIEGGQVAVYHEGGPSCLTYGEHNIDADPEFVEVFGLPWMLGPDSPCIDAGQTHVSAELHPWDLGGNERVWDGNGDGMARLDMGCYEYQTMYSPVNLHFDLVGQNVNLSWSQPARSLTGWRVYRDSVCIAESPAGGPPSYTDEQAPPGDHEYYVTALWGHIESDPTNTVWVHVVSSEDDIAFPAFALFGNHPNPFNPSTTIRYSIPADGHVEVSVYNAKGQLVSRLVSESQKAGEHSVTWTAEGCASG
ncbi:MAG: right-handed parallel beta-helix repeat-containing protein, partial [Candidatus Cloacimonetes bacterium]|nr:right-handed parallel beta-helix repeat-containing protein [Candidatus Cloacimonadota bacterium]